MKQISIFLLLFLSFFTNLTANDLVEFSQWKKNFKNIALANNISEKTFDMTMANVKFLPKVIEYDRYQP